jgi:hypothetical protein
MVTCKVCGEKVEFPWDHKPWCVDYIEDKEYSEPPC